MLRCMLLVLGGWRVSGYVAFFGAVGPTNKQSGRPSFEPPDASPRLSSRLTSSRLVCPGTAASSLDQATQANASTRPHSTRSTDKGQPAGQRTSHLPPFLALPLCAPPRSRQTRRVRNPHRSPSKGNKAGLACVSDRDDCIVLPTQARSPSRSLLGGVSRRAVSLGLSGDRIETRGIPSLIRNLSRRHHSLTCETREGGKS